MIDATIQDRLAEAREARRNREAEPMLVFRSPEGEPHGSAVRESEPERISYRFTAGEKIRLRRNPNAGTATAIFVRDSGVVETIVPLLGRYIHAPEDLEPVLDGLESVLI